MKDWPSYLDLPKPQPMPQTNFDRLRSLSDEELAKSRIRRECSLFYAKDVPEYIFTSLDDAIKAEIEWGRQPYKEEPNE